MSWDRPILTDSGGYQVFSLAKNRQIDDDGVIFKSHINGSLHKFTPEKSIAIQENLGADIIMAFDECTSPYDLDNNEVALKRTHACAERCLKVKISSDQALFGIVQGGIYPELRKQSAEYLTSLDFPGYAIGGLSDDNLFGRLYTILFAMYVLLYRATGSTLEESGQLAEQHTKNEFASVGITVEKKVPETPEKVPDKALN